MVSTPMEGNPNGVEGMLHNGGSQDAHWIPDEGVQMITKRQYRNQQECDQNALPPDARLKP
jgi:hypothetical protein